MKYNDLRKKMRSAVFSSQDLRLMKDRVFGYQLSFWQKQGLIYKIRNGLWAFEDRLDNVASEEIAGMIYSPSYISLEKALSVYGIIPEMVYTTTCITPKVTRTFKNRLGIYIYRHIKPSLFFGYGKSGAGGQKYLMAEPEKAFLDFIYFNLNKIKTKQDFTSFRFNQKVLQKEISEKKLFDYLKKFNSVRMERVVDFILNGDK